MELMAILSAFVLGAGPAALGFLLAGRAGRARAGGRVMLALLFSQSVLLFMALSALMEEYDMAGLTAALTFWLAGLAASLAVITALEKRHGWRLP